jgi:hypothetical protein
MRKTLPGDATEEDTRKTDRGPTTITPSWVKVVDPLTSTCHVVNFYFINSIPWG